nr:hypothetical protein [Tanacetum cinerariifolium]
MFMQLLYVHATISEQVIVEDQTPLMKSWDTMKLKLREKKELNMGGFGRLCVKEAKDQGDTLRHVYTPKVDLEYGAFGDAEGSNKMETIKQFQKRTAEDMEIDINKTLKFMGSIQTKVDKMIEMDSIAYPENKTFKKLVEIMNENLLKVFKPGKICVVLELGNEIY